MELVVILLQMVISILDFYFYFFCVFQEGKNFLRCIQISEVKLCIIGSKLKFNMDSIVTRMMFLLLKKQQQKPQHIGDNGKNSADARDLDK